LCSEANQIFLESHTSSAKSTEGHPTGNPNSGRGIANDLKIPSLEQIPRYDKRNQTRDATM
jgi:hypothetical protein